MNNNEDYEENLISEETDSDFASMLEEQEKSKSTSGGIISAVIVKISDETILLDTNQKTEKKMHISEIQDSNGELMFKVNDTIDIIIEQNKPSYKKVLVRKKLKDFIASLDESEDNKDIKVKVASKNKGGYIVEYNEMSFFMPRSLSMLKSAEDNVGREIDVKIVKHDINDGVLVSRKHLLEVRNSVNEEKVKELLAGNTTVTCKIEKIVNFGIFVDIDGVTGIVRYNELSYKGNVNPSENFTVGDEVKAKLLKFDEKRKILELSIKALLDNPWDSIDEQLKVGDIVLATVANIQAYGAFVNIKDKDLDGLLHISEISWDRGLKNPSDKVKVGQELELKVIDINKEKQQLKCSLKQLSEKPFTKFIAKYDIGDKVSGKIVHITDFGAFVHIDFMDCLLLNVDCSWDKGDTCKSLFKVGEEIEVTIATIDKENEKVSLSKKSLMPSPVDKFAKTYSLGDKIKGTLANIKDFGIFVNIENLMDIFIPIKDIYPLKVAELKIGQEIQSTIVDINIKNSKVRCSIKEPSENDTRGGGFDGNMKSFGDDSKTTLGDIIRVRKEK